MLQKLHLSAIVAAVIFGSTAHSADPPFKKRFIYNSDGGNIFIDKQPPMKPKDVYSYVDEVAGTDVTTYFICPNFGMPLMYPGKVTEMLGQGPSVERSALVDKAGAKNKSTTERAIVNLRALVAAGHDPIGLVVDRAREKKLEVFITFRLNEAHEVDRPESLIVSHFWRQHPEWRVGKLGEPIGDLIKEILGPRVNPVVHGWFPGALNFAVPEVRQLRLAELKECCERFPIDGLDLDFQRFPIYFPQGKGADHVATMTAWVREVRAMTQGVGRRRGRPFLLSARILAKPEQCRLIGLDPATWVREGLLDFVTVSHNLRNDFPLPIAEYRRLLPGVPLYASIEVEPRPEKYRAIARRLWEDKVDGLLLFNFFTWREGGREPPFALLRELGDPTKIKAGGGP